jgi:hypothetical protein
MGTRAPVLNTFENTRIPDGIIDKLKQRYLLRNEPRFGVDWLEISHDRLVGPISRANAEWFSRFAGVSSSVVIGCFALGVMVFLTFPGRVVEVSPQHRTDVLRVLFRQNPDIATFILAHSYANRDSLRFPERNVFLSPAAVNSALLDPRLRQPELAAYLRASAPIVNLMQRGGIGAIGSDGRFSVWPSQAGGSDPALPQSMIVCQRAEYTKFTEKVAAAIGKSSYKFCAVHDRQKAVGEMSFDSMKFRFNSFVIGSDESIGFALKCRADGECGARTVEFTSNEQSDWQQLKLPPAKFRSLQAAAAGGSFLAIAFCEGESASICTVAEPFRQIARDV